MTFTLQAAWDFVGGLGKPSKMPCYSYSISALKCQIGRKLAEIKDSVCNKCYAMRGNYLFKVVINAHEKRLEAISKPEWVEAMVTVINGYDDSGYFRWFDSGDVQDLEMLEKICEVAKRLPHVKFWLPTKQYNYVAQWREKHGKFPANLNVRLSAYIIEEKPSETILQKLGVTGSSVTKGSEFNCPSSLQGNKCLTCRLCWDSNHKLVTYHYH